MDRRIYQDDGSGDYWVATSIEDARRQYDECYGLDESIGEYDEDFFRKIPDGETIEMYMVDELIVEKRQIPDGGIVREEGYLVIEATAAQWLAHLPDDVSSPWLKGEW